MFVRAALGLSYHSPSGGHVHMYLGTRRPWLGWGAGRGLQESGQKGPSLELLPGDGNENTAGLNRRFTGSLGAQGHFLPEDQGSVHCLQDPGPTACETRAVCSPLNAGTGLGKAAGRMQRTRLITVPPCASSQSTDRRWFYVFVHLHSRMLKEPAAETHI